ncbi:hypothetical protein F2Q69_00047387 [Brassica cretica]|uniref:Uncharacterized protein n=1 Tax=Brassica cretica TaxID=69181 RepID=A0A8S9PPA7_BRACR|nr:hypothetical protein F2Q69_00047387 [Brassica cretica]
MHTPSDKLMNVETLKLLYCFGTHLDKPQGIPREKLPIRLGKKKDVESSNDGSRTEAREARAAGREAKARVAEARESENHRAMARRAREHAREARAREVEGTKQRIVNQGPVKQGFVKLQLE